MNIDAIVAELDRLYEFDITKYVDECNHWKRCGYRVLRNSEGKHKIVPPQTASGQSVDINEAFGGIFGQIFNGK